MKREQFYRLLARRYPGIRFKSIEFTWTATRTHADHQWSAMREEPRLVVRGTPGQFRIPLSTQSFPTLDAAKSAAEESAFQQIWDTLCQTIPKQ